MWSPKEGLMDEKSHTIVYYNSISQSVERFLSGLQYDIPYDCSISSNPSSILWDDIGFKKLKQALRLSKYYLQFKRTMSETSRPKTNLQKAIFNHFFTTNEPERNSEPYEPYVLPECIDAKKETIVGVCSQFITRNDRLSIIICSNIENITAKIDVLIPNLEDSIKEIIKTAADNRSIILINYINRVGEQLFDFEHSKRNSFLIFDMNDFQYSSFLSVSSFY